MDLKDFLISAVIIFVVVLIVNAVVVYLFEGALSWNFGLAIALGIALPLAQVLRKKK